MFRSRWQPAPQVVPTSNHAIILILGTANLLFNIIANSSFKVSASSESWRGFLTWQVIGNLAGFITVLTLTGLLRHVPLRIAYPVTTGLAVIGVQIVAAGLLFGEPISGRQLLGTVFVAAGIFCIGGR